MMNHSVVEKPERSRYPTIMEIVATPKPVNAPLDPERYPQGDLFFCDILDAAPKGDMASMEHPIFSLSTKPETRKKRYENGPNWIEIRPSERGLATVHDRGHSDFLHLEPRRGHE